MSLLAKLQASGVRVYGGEVYQETKTIDTLKLNDNAVVIESKMYPGSYQINIEEGGRQMFIPIRRGVSHELDTYTLKEYVATRDYKETKQGTKKVFAVAS